MFDLKRVLFNAISIEAIGAINEKLYLLKGYSWGMKGVMLKV
jgi:hypothetical protein